MSDNWIVSNLENALADWNGKLGEIWALLTQSPETFKGGTIWSLILNVHNALVGIGYGLLVLFFAMAIFQSAASFRDFQRPEYVLRHLIRFILAKTAVGRCMEIMTAIFNICGGITQTVMSGRLHYHGGIAARRDRDRDRGGGPVGEHPPVAGVPVGHPLYNRHVLYSAAHRLRALFPAVYVYRPGSLAVSLLCRSNHVIQRQGVH